MSNETPSAEGLVTADISAPPPAPVSETHVVTDPAAALDPAAPLDPAKAQPKAKAKRKAKRKPSKKAAAKRAEAGDAGKVKAMAQGKAMKATETAATATSAEGKAAYEAAELHQVASYADMPEGAPLSLRFSDGSAFLDGAIDVGHDDFVADGLHMACTKRVEFAPDGPSVRVTEAWLVADSGEAVCCEIPGGLVTGGQHLAAIPAKHLIF